MQALRSVSWLVASAVISCLGGCSAAPARPGATHPDGSGSGAAGTGGGSGTGVAGTGGEATAGSAGSGLAGTGGSGLGGASGQAADAGTDADADAPGDTAASDGSTACKTVGNELCEDFESGAIDPRIWGMHTTSGASLTVDGMHVHHGTHALHVKMVAGAQGIAQITDAVTFPAKNNTFYTRAYFYISPDLPHDTMGGYHMAYLLATGNNDLGFVEAGLGSAGNKQYLGYSEYYGAGPDVHAHGATFTEFGPDSPTMVVPQQWICLELLQGGDATTTHRRVWVDGKELPEQMSDYSGRKPPQFSLMSIGVLQYHQTPTLTDVWVDDIRVSSSPIGCDPL
jgi:hypothetical protein